MSRTTGLSPRGRGKLFPFAGSGGYSGSIPAWAGETRIDGEALNSRQVYPRVGGGNRQWTCGGCGARGLSPRGRGKLYVAVPERRSFGSIPAWAGETISCPPSRLPEGVYPRVGGGNVLGEICPLLTYGLSPRGRGKHRGNDQLLARSRSIPAWAGETRRTQPPLSLSCGLSPRGRGKLIAHSFRVSVDRSIPAWAGETGLDELAGIDGAVYPRVGGGNALKIA